MKVLLEEWSYIASTTSTAIVVPDGCRDLIIKQDGAGKISCFTTSLVSTSYNVETPAGSVFRGFRLAAGTTIDERELLLFVQGRSCLSFSDGDWLEEFCFIQPSVYEALEGLRSDVSSIEEVSKHLGVSMRTLQRHVKSETGKSPLFWRSLVRARRCARLIARRTTFADAALYSGYSDQSHMTRELKKWFGCTPTALSSGALQEDICSSGYD